MVSSHVENPVSGVKLSSVVPGKVTGENKVHELTNMDLALKLHYLKGLYFFKSDAVQGLTIYNLKEPMFPLLNLFYQAAGRIRRSETGRPFIKCNDSGMRIVEAYCNMTIDEWLAVNDHSLHNRLVYDQVLGPDLGFSPLVFIQFTWFKCGGISVGLSWAHVLGDAFSAATFINMWGQIMAGHVPPKSVYMPNSRKFEFPPSISQKPFSVKRVDPVWDNWVTASNCKMETHSFHVTAKQLNHLRSIISPPSQSAKTPPFEALCATIWKYLAKIRGESAPKIVTIYRKNSLPGENELLANNQVLGIVEAEFSIANAELMELTCLVAEKMTDESRMIGEMIEGDDGKTDFAMYGSNLTFINLEEANIYGLELKGQKPIYVNYTMGGVSDEGVVLVLPAGVNGGGSGGGRTVTVTLPENQLAKLKNELKKEWGII